MSQMITVFKNEDPICTGRLVGLIDNEECRAVINSPGAGKKIFTAADMSMSSVNSSCTGKRFVVATSNYGDTLRKIFISPVIGYISYTGVDKNFKCKDDSSYAVREII